MQQITTVSFKVPVDLAVAVRVEAARQDKSRSAAIREGLRLWLAAHRGSDDNQAHNDADQSQGVRQ